MMLMAAGAESEVPIHSMYDKVFNSYFGTISYSFADRYYVDLAARRDGFFSVCQKTTSGQTFILWEPCGI